jgi:integrase
VVIARAQARQAAIDGRNAARPPGAEREPDVALVGLKTVKRHFSALSPYWHWLEIQGHAPEDTNPFVGFDWPGVHRGREGRDAWSEDDLRTLHTSPKFAPGAERGTFWWITVVGMYAGMRLEEIARLRIHLDIRELHGRLAFVIQEHPDLWNPTTEAGARIVPVHPVLLKLGFKTPVFGGRPPVEFVISGTLDGLLTVRRFLDATCRGEYMSASEVDAGFRGYRDVDIVFS